MARRHLGERVSHLSTHMGTAVATPELRAITEKLAREFALKLEAPKPPRGRWSGNALSAEQKERGLTLLLEGLGPGTWMIVEHPGLNTPELRNLGHKGYENVAADRAGVTHAFTSASVKEVITRRKIALISYTKAGQ